MGSSALHLLALFGLVGALVLVAGIVASAVTIRRNGRSSVFALLGCVAMLLGTAIQIGYGAIVNATRAYSFGYGQYVIVNVVAGALGSVGVVLLLLGAILPRREPRPRFQPRAGYGYPVPPGAPYELSQGSYQEYRGPADPAAPVPPA